MSLSRDQHYSRNGKILTSKECDHDIEQAETFHHGVHPHCNTSRLRRCGVLLVLWCGLVVRGFTVGCVVKFPLQYYLVLFQIQSTLCQLFLHIPRVA